uniref:ATP-dependent RNA helicase DDX19A-like n=1 Tax=Myxine glutinosa TaxID=7769 RepID=UPI00358DE69D
MMDSWSKSVDDQESRQLTETTKSLNNVLGTMTLGERDTKPASASASPQTPTSACRTPVPTTVHSSPDVSVTSSPKLDGAVNDCKKNDEDNDLTINKAEVSLLNKLVRQSLAESRHDIEVKQRDPSSPLYSVHSFEELHLMPELLKGVYNMGFNRPSRIQETALPLMLAQPFHNLIAQSQSGTGKTAAFVLAMLSRVDATKRHPQCLCLSPTFELALQTGTVIEQMSKFCPDIRLLYAIRGNRLERGTHCEEQIVIGTPGTLLDWCTKLRIVDPQNIKVFVLDEADVMIATQGHKDQSIRIKKLLPSDCQMLFFSATFEDSVWAFAQRIVPDPNVIRLRRDEETLVNIKQYFIMCRDRNAKFQALCNIYGAITIAQVMIFCETRRMATWLVEQMSREGHQVGLLTGELTVEQRAAVIQRFKEGKEKVLITTNVCARGIDVAQVTAVINFDLPVDRSGRADAETYLHRIGRTGRFGKQGLAINMVEGENGKHILHDIEKHFNRTIQKLDADDIDEIEKIKG